MADALHEAVRALRTGLTKLEDPTDEQVRELFNDHGFEVWTVNELVSYNLRRARLDRGWSQEQLADLLGKATGRPWSNVTVSAAERARETGRTRRFDASELLAFARVFLLPVTYFLLPPDTNNADFERLFITGSLETFGTAEGWEASALLTNGILEAVQPASYPPSFVDRLRPALKTHAGRDWSPHGSALDGKSFPVPPADLVNMLRQTARMIEVSLGTPGPPQTHTIAPDSAVHGHSANTASVREDIEPLPQGKAFLGVRRGYDKQQVDRYVAMAEQEIATLAAERETAYTQVMHLQGMVQALQQQLEAADDRRKEAGS